MLSVEWMIDSQSDERPVKGSRLKLLSWSHDPLSFIRSLSVCIGGQFKNNFEIKIFTKFIDDLKLPLQSKCKRYKKNKRIIVFNESV